MTTELQNKVWRILPAEFRKVVKAHYAGLNVAYDTLLSEDSLTNEACDKCSAIREKMAIYNMYFGQHNLTSDAEGEDELLTVSRKQVQEMYAKNIAASNSDGHSSYDYGYYDGVMNILSSLFGSKCLPDEEPKPAEPKYHKGDKVRTMKVMSKDYVGKVGTINCQDDGGYIVDYDDGSHVWSAESDLEPYTEPTKEASLNVNHSDLDIDELVAKGYVPDPAKQFDSIIKNGFIEHNRLHIAAILCAGMLANGHNFYPIDRALELADALIAKCEKGGNNA